MDIRRIVINADPDWAFRQYTRTYALDLYRTAAGVTLWDLTGTSGDRDDREFWGDWPIAAGSDISPMEEDLDSAISSLKSSGRRRVAVIVVLSLQDMKALDDDELLLSSAAKRAQRLVRRIFEVIDREAGEIGSVADIASSVWVSLVVRTGGESAQSQRIAEVACKKIVEGYRTASVHNCFFLSSSAANEMRDDASEIHFHKLRMLIDMVSQTDVDRERYADMWRQLRSRRHGAAYVARLVLERPYDEVSWTTSDVMRLSLLNWRDEQLESAAGIDEQAEGLNESIKKMLAAVDRQTQQDVMDETLASQVGYDFERSGIDPTAPELTEANWPKYRRMLLMFDERHASELQAAFDRFILALEKLYAQYLELAPQFIDRERRRQKEERERMSADMERLESGLADAVVETANLCRVDVARQRTRLCDRAAKIREEVHSKFVPQIKDTNENFVGHTQIQDLARYHDLVAAFDQTVDCANKLSILRQCLIAGTLCTGAFLLISFLAVTDLMSIFGSAEPEVRIPDPDQPAGWWAWIKSVIGWHEAGGKWFFVGMMFATSLLTFGYATQSYTNRFHRAYDWLKLKSTNARDAVEEIPKYTYRYGATLGQASQLGIIEGQLRNLASAQSRSKFKNGFSSMAAGRRHDVDDMPDQARTLRHRIDQDQSSNLRTGLPHERIRKLLSKIELDRSAGSFDLLIAENRGSDPIPVESGHIYSDRVRIEPLSRR